MKAWFLCRIKFFPVPWGNTSVSQSRFLRFLVGSCCLLPVFFVTSPVHAETLSEALSGALAQNPTLEQAIAAQKMAHEELRIERSNYFPTLSASTAAGRVYGNNSTSRGLSVTRGDGYSNMWEGSLSINQMIFDGLKTPRLVGAAKAREAASEQALKDAQESLALQTALAYLNVLRTRESLSVLNGYSGTLSGYESKIQKMVTEGAADQAELEQARSLGLELRSLLAGFQGQARSADAEFSRLTGHMPEAAMTKPDSIGPDLPISVDEAISFATKAHPQIKMAEREIDAANLTASAQTSALFPTVTGELSAYNKDLDDVIGGEVEDNRALVRLNWSLSAGGAEFAKVDKAKEDGARSKAHKDELLRRIEATIRTAYADLEATDQQKEISLQRLKSNEDLLGAYHAQFEGGKVRILQLLQAENQVLNARLEALNAEYRALAAEYSVLGSVGQMQNKLALNTQSSHVK